MKPHSPASERNREPILEKLRIVFTERTNHVLEIGAGTGQHACAFAPEFPWLTWTASDLAIHHPGIQRWFADCPAANLHGPVEFEIGKTEFPKGPFDSVYAANVLHIISWEKVVQLVALLGESLPPGADVVIYGPFKYEGRFTSLSNAEFDLSLRARDPASGIRDFEEVQSAMRRVGFDLKHDFGMPANNQLLHFSKRYFNERTDA